MAVPQQYSSDDGHFACSGQWRIENNCEKKSISRIQFQAHVDTHKRPYCTCTTANGAFLVVHSYIHITTTETSITNGPSPLIVWNWAVISHHRLFSHTVTPGFKGKSECIEHMCARIKFHTCVDSVYTKTQCKSVKRVLKLYYMNECLKIVT
jgi:hypothetical protein